MFQCKRKQDRDGFSCRVLEALNNYSNVESFRKELIAILYAREMEKLSADYYQVTTSFLHDLRSLVDSYKRDDLEEFFVEVSKIRNSAVHGN